MQPCMDYAYNTYCTSSCVQYLVKSSRANIKVCIPPVAQTTNITLYDVKKKILHGKILYHHCLFTNLQWMLDYYDRDPFSESIEDNDLQSRLHWEKKK